MAYIKKFSELNENISHFGQELIDLLKEYDLGIHKVEKGDFLRGAWELPHEDEYPEYRVTIAKLITEESVKSDYNDEPPKEGEEGYEDYIKDMEKIGQTEIDNYNDMTFSVFVPEQKIDYGFQVKCLIAGAEYLSMLSQSTTEVYDSPPLDGRTVYGFHSGEIMDFRKFLKLNNIKVTNDNFEIIGLYSTRIYKDSKFFYELEQYCNDNSLSYKELINDVLNLV